MFVVCCAWLSFVVCSVVCSLWFDICCWLSVVCCLLLLFVDVAWGVILFNACCFGVCRRLLVVWCLVLFFCGCMVVVYSLLTVDSRCALFVVCCLLLVVRCLTIVYCWSLLEVLVVVVCGVLFVVS